MNLDELSIDPDSMKLNEVITLKKSKFPQMQWKISKYRRDQRSGVLNPVRPGDYYKYLAGVIDSEQEPNRASS